MRGALACCDVCLGILRKASEPARCTVGPLVLTVRNFWGCGVIPFLRLLSFSGWADLMCLFSCVKVVPSPGFFGDLFGACAFAVGLLGGEARGHEAADAPWS